MSRPFAFCSHVSPDADVGYKTGTTTDNGSTAMPRERADRVLVTRGLFESRTRAQAAIAAGHVIADGVPVRKASDTIAPDAVIESKPEHPYVSRGAVKLAAALDHFHIDVAGSVCIDVGASTGGFSEVLTLRGARKVYAVDVGSGQLHPRLQALGIIVSLEQTDIRALDPAKLDPQPDFATIDVSFISLKHVLPPVTALLARPSRLVALIKPQFEAPRRFIKKGIVREEAVQKAVCEDIGAHAAALGWDVGGILASPIPGGDGNREFLVAAERT
jgi:23S rRNA (cytidine1920-2'-O)/16S rRNA (cytidine1409-2'-O)-methyltransferase